MSETVKEKKLLTLCVIHDEEKILLGMKKRGFGEGRWNGFGGKLTEGESIEEAAIRELSEEAGIIAKELEKRAIFTFTGEDEKDLEVHVFKVNSFEGEPIESEEMRPSWFLHKEIPYSEMWPDDIHWLPLFLQGKKLKGTFHFNNDILESHTLEESMELK